MSEENKALIRHVWDEIFHKGNLGAIDEHVAADAVFPSAPPGTSPDREGFKQVIGAFLAAFPDVRVVFQDQVAEGEKVASRVSVSGTHQGEFAGVAATGKEIDYGGLNFAEVKGGKIVAVWGATDQLRLLRQIGAMPS